MIRIVIAALALLAIGNTAKACDHVQQVQLVQPYAVQYAAPLQFVVPPAYYAPTLPLAAYSYQQTFAVQSYAAPVVYQQAIVVPRFSYRNFDRGSVILRVRVR